MAGLTNAFRIFWDALFPRSCVMCKEEGSLLCAPCKERVKIPAWFVLAEHGNVRIFSRVSYKERAVQKLLHAWKYQGDKTAGEEWKAWISEGESPEIFTGAVFVPVPLARETYAERGFNQAQELAKALADKHGGSVLNLLERLPRKAQAKTKKKERGEVRKASPYFATAACAKLRDRGSFPAQIILVDDVSTTGSTILACADILRGQGIEAIFACTLAFGNDA